MTSKKSKNVLNINEIREKLLAAQVAQICAADVTRDIKNLNQDQRMIKPKRKSAKKKSPNAKSDSKRKKMVSPKIERSHTVRNLNLPTVCKDDLKYAYDLLQGRDTICVNGGHKWQTPKKSSCLKNILELKNEENNLHWSSPTYMMHNIRTCFLQNDWSKMAYLLQELSQQNYDGHLNSYLWRTCCINLLVNPADENEVLLDEFLKKCFSKPNNGPYDIKYMYRECTKSDNEDCF